MQWSNDLTTMPGNPGPRVRFPEAEISKTRKPRVGDHGWREDGACSMVWRLDEPPHVLLLFYLAYIIFFASLPSIVEVESRGCRRKHQNIHFSHSDPCSCKGLNRNGKLSLEIIRKLPERINAVKCREYWRKEPQSSYLPVIYMEL